MRELEERMDSAEVTEWVEYYAMLAAAEKTGQSVDQFLDTQRRAVEEGYYQFPEG